MEVNLTKIWKINELCFMSHLYLSTLIFIELIPKNHNLNCEDRKFVKFYFKSEILVTIVHTRICPYSSIITFVT